MTKSMHSIFMFTVVFCAVFLMAGNSARAAGDWKMVWNSLRGDGTTSENQSFIRKLSTQPPAPSNNAWHYWATQQSGPVVVDSAQGVPPLEPSPPSSSHAARIMRKLPPPARLGMILGGSEFLLMMFKRSGKKAVSKDRHTLGLIWLVSMIFIPLGVMAAYWFQGCYLPWPGLALKTGYGLFVVGMLIRWQAIFYLGRFFTTNVAIASDHRVIDTGPYRYIRHPSYAGSMIQLAGFCLSFNNWASMLIIFIPCFLVNHWRIHVEEKALLEALGEPYRRYVARTKRLIPKIY